MIYQGLHHLAVAGAGIVAATGMTAAALARLFRRASGNREPEWEVRLHSEQQQIIVIIAEIKHLPFTAFG